MADIDVFKNEFVPNIQSFSKLSYSTWKSQNPGEAAKWEPYRDAVLAGQSPAPPSMTTKFGKALVAAGQLVQQVAPPPPPSGPLSWKPPGWNGGDPKLATSYPGYMVINLANNGSNREPALAANTDYFIKIDNFDCAAAGGGIFLAGGRNIVIVGGRVYASGLTHYLGFGIQNPYGTVHIEGVDFAGPGLSTVMSIRTETSGGYPYGGYTSPPGAIIQIQNCRFYSTVPPGRTFSWEHPDYFQFEGNGTTHAFAGTVRLDRVTASICNTGFNAGTDATKGVPNVLLRNVNHHFNTGADGTTLTAYMTQWYRTSFAMTVENWYGEVGAPAGHDVIEHCLQPTAPGGRPAGGGDAPVRLTDGLGAYAEFPAVSNLFGKFREGNPPGGDYCPNGTPGTGYVSPLYV